MKIRFVRVATMVSSLMTLVAVTGAGQKWN